RAHDDEPESGLELRWSKEPEGRRHDYDDDHSNENPEHRVSAARRRVFGRREARELVVLSLSLRRFLPIALRLGRLALRPHRRRGLVGFDRGFFISTLFRLGT